MKTLLLLLILFPINLYGQDWKFLEPDDELLKSVVSLSVKEVQNNQIVTPSATGVIIEKTDIVAENNKDYVLGKILTCEHLGSGEVNAIFWNSKTTKGRIFKRDKQSDLMLIKCYVHKDTSSVEVLDYTNPHGIVYGMGGNPITAPTRDKIRVFGGNRIGPQTFKYFLDTRPIPGDSGAPIFYEGRLSGIVSGGYEWFNREDGKGSYTWPLRTATPQSIRKFLDE